MHLREVSLNPMPLLNLPDLWIVFRLKRPPDGGCLKDYLIVSVGCTVSCLCDIRDRTMADVRRTTRLRQPVGEGRRSRRQSTEREAIGLPRRPSGADRDRAAHERA